MLRIEWNNWNFGLIVSGEHLSLKNDFLCHANRKQRNGIEDYSSEKE
jgi:hypothetical protein